MGGGGGVARVMQVNTSSAGVALGKPGGLPEGVGEGVCALLMFMMFMMMTIVCYQGVTTPPPPPPRNTKARPKWQHA